jgi:hypothetical protein
MMHPRLSPAALASALLLIGCTAQPRADLVPPPPPPVVASAGCRIGPQDGPPPAPGGIADRGIGGTGTAGSTTLVDRGIGGTGTASGGASVLADRGIGGTGLVGVITGFASICMDGVEVGYGPATAVTSDTGEATPDALRVGQLAVVQADAGGLAASSVALRHEVIGQVDSVSADGLLHIAGQLVRLTQQTRGGTPAVGDRVAVSGFRDADGMIAASRFDPAPAGRVSVHGLLSHDAHGPHIGALLLHVPHTLRVPPDGAVTAAGRELQGVLYVDVLVPDLLIRDPAGVFAPATSQFYVESIVSFGLGGPIDPDVFYGGPVVVRLQRQRDGTLLRLSATPAPAGPITHPGARSAGPGRPGATGYGPAPVPNGRMAPGRAGNGGPAGGPGRFGGRRRPNADNPGPDQLGPPQGSVSPPGPGGH